MESTKFVRSKLFIWSLVIAIGTCIWLYLYLTDYFATDGFVYVTSVSSDGNYAITTSTGKFAILWDIKHKKKKILDINANIYSAYFIKNTPYYMWQDLDNVVHIQDIAGHIIKTFNPGFPTYGEVMTSDLENYIASNREWGLYSIDDKGNKTLLMNEARGGFLGAQKLLNLTLSSDSHYLLTSGLGTSNYIPTLPKEPLVPIGDVALWDLQKLKPIRLYVGNKVKTFATLSPDDRYVVAGDEGSFAYVWDIHTGKQLYDLYSLNFGRLIKNGNNVEDWTWDNTGLIQEPRDIGDYFQIMTMKFITDHHYLRFIKKTPYAVLYDVLDPKPLKYLSLKAGPLPSLDRYTRDQSIDTAPKAHILVMGKANKPGILVYRYDPEQQELIKIWDAR